MNLCIPPLPLCLSFHPNYFSYHSKTCFVFFGPRVCPFSRIVFKQCFYFNGFSLLLVMKVYGVTIPVHKGLTNLELAKYVQELKIPNFRGVFMKDSLPKEVNAIECGIMNFNTSDQPGSHWVCYYKDLHRRIYFDSFGQITPIELQKYLKTAREFDAGVGVILRNTDIVQRVNTHVCGHLCLFVLTSLSREHLSFQTVLQELNDGYTQGYW